jgi:hypothetical protein
VHFSTGQRYELPGQGGPLSTLILEDSVLRPAMDHMTTSVDLFDNHRRGTGLTRPQRTERGGLCRPTSSLEGRYKSPEAAVHQIGITVAQPTSERTPGPTIGPFEGAKPHAVRGTTLDSGAPLPHHRR